MRYFYSLILLFLIACQGSDKKKTDDDSSGGGIGQAIPVSFALINSTYLNEFGKYQEIKAIDFKNGEYPLDLKINKKNFKVDVINEESYARNNKIFASGLGFLFALTPAQSSSATITLTSNKGSQTVKKVIGDDGLMAVSLFSFDQLYPPSFRTKYELKVIIESPQQMTYNYFFAVQQLENLQKYINTEQFKVFDLVLGKNYDKKEAISLTVNSDCNDCIIKVEKVDLKMLVKYFSETPVLPTNDRYAVTKPKRYSGLLVSQKYYELKTTTENNNTGSVSVQYLINDNILSIKNKCMISTDNLCSFLDNNKSTPSFYGYIQAVTQDMNEKRMGSVWGIQSARIVGTVEYKVLKDTNVLDSQKINVESNRVSPYNDNTLPAFVLDEFRKATQTGAVEISWDKLTDLMTK